MLHTNCSEVPGCARKADGYNAHMMEDTKANVGSWDSDFSGFGSAIGRSEVYSTFRRIHADGSRIGFWI
jgi:hypothetical protein